MPDEEQQKESTITFKSWALVALVAAVFGFFFVTVLAHESRITRVEVTQETSIRNIERSLDKLSLNFERHLESIKK